MTTAERQRRLRERRKREVVSLRNKLQLIEGAKSRPATEVLPPGDIADQSRALMRDLSKFYEKFDRVFGPRFEDWYAQNPPAEARMFMNMHLEGMGETFLDYASRPDIDGVKQHIDERRVAEAIEELGGLEWLVRRWPECTRLAMAKKIMERAGVAPTLDWGTRLSLIVGMIEEAVPSYEQRLALYAGLVKVMPDDILADYVRALRPADCRRLAAELAKRPSGRAPDHREKQAAGKPSQEDIYEMRALSSTSE